MEWRERCQKANFSILPAPCSLMSKTTKEGTFRWTQASENHRCRGRSNSINVAGPKKVFNLSRPSAADAADKAEQKKQFEQLRRWNFWNHSSRCERARGERERGRASRQSGLKIFSLFDFGGRTTSGLGEREGTAVNGRPRPIPVRPRVRLSREPRFYVPCSKVSRRARKGWNPFPLSRSSARVNK